MGKRIDWIKRGLARKFTFDGCTGVPNFHIKRCCDIHDYDYQDLTKSKWKADWHFLRCMWRRSQNRPLIENIKRKVIAVSYCIGVTVLGWFYWKGKQNESLQDPFNRDGNGGPN